MYALAAVAPAPHCNSTQGVEPCDPPFSIPVIEGACMCSPRWRRREHSLPCRLPRKTGKNENALFGKGVDCFRFRFREAMGAGLNLFLRAEQAALSARDGAWSRCHGTGTGPRARRRALSTHCRSLAGAGAAAGVCWPRLPPSAGGSRSGGARPGRGACAASAWGAATLPGVSDGEYECATVACASRSNRLSTPLSRCVQVYPIYSEAHGA